MSANTQGLEEYFRTKHYKDGLNRCNRLLKKSTSDPILHIYRARFLRALGQTTEADAVIKSLTGGAITIPDSTIAEDIDIFIWEGQLDSAYPPALSNGPETNKLWASLASTTPRGFHATLHKDRYIHAVTQQRWIDAGYALSAWRKIEPNNRDLRLGHSAVYQLISESSNDEMTVKMNAQLADRTMQQLLGQDPSIADLKLMIKICRRQKSYARLPEFVEKHSHLIWDDPLCKAELIELLKEAHLWVQLDKLTGPEVKPLVDFWRHKSDQGHTKTEDWRVVEAGLMAYQEIYSDTLTKVLYTQSSDEHIDEELLKENSTTRMGYLWMMKHTKSWERLMYCCYNLFHFWATSIECFNILKEFILALPEDYQLQLRQRISKAVPSLRPPSGDETVAPEEIQTWLGAEATALRIDYLLTVAQMKTPTVDDIYDFVHNAIRLHTFSFNYGSMRTRGFQELITSALLRASEIEPSQEHLILAASALYQPFYKDSNFDVTHIQLYSQLGLFRSALRAYQNLSIKEIQMETSAHMILTRISITYPFGQDEAGANSPREVLCNALKMYGPTANRISDQQSDLLECQRFDLLLELEDLRKSLERSTVRRHMILELRRLDRLNNFVPSNEYVLHPARVETWTSDLKDNRDYGYRSWYNPNPDRTETGRKMQDGLAAPDADWIRYHLWIDEICSLSHGQSLLVQPFLDTAAATGPVEQSSSFTREEKAMVPLWTALGQATILTMSPDAATTTPPSTQNIGGALEELSHLLLSLTREAMIPKDDSFAPLPMITAIRSMFLQMDFLKAVERFVLAASAKFKADGNKQHRQTLDQVKEVAQRYFYELQNYAKDRRAAMNTEKLARLIESLWKRVMRTESADKPLGEEVLIEKLGALQLWDHPEYISKAWNFIRPAGLFVEDAKGSWNGVLQVKFTA